MNKSFAPKIQCSSCQTVLIRPTTFTDHQPMITFATHSRLLVQKNLALRQDIDGLKTHLICRNCKQNVGFYFTSKSRSTIQMVLGKDKVVFKSNCFEVNCRMMLSDLKTKAKQRIIHGNQEIIGHLQQEFLKNTIKVISLNTTIEQLNKKVERASDKLEGLLQALSRKA